MAIQKRFASEDYAKSEIQTELEKIDLSTLEPKIITMLFPKNYDLDAIVLMLEAQDDLPRAC